MYVDAVIWGIWIQIFLQWWKLGSQTLTGTGWASSWRLVGANPLCFLLRSFSLVQQLSSISYLNQIALEILFGMLQWPCRPMAQALLDTWRSTRIKARMPCGGACRQHSTHGLRNSGRTKLNFLRTKCWILPTTSLWILKLKVKPLTCCKLLAHIFSFWRTWTQHRELLGATPVGGSKVFYVLTPCRLRGLRKKVSVNVPSWSSSWRTNKHYAQNQNSIFNDIPILLWRFGFFKTSHPSWYLAPHRK